MGVIGDNDLVVRNASDSGYPTLRDQYLHSHKENIVDFDRFVSLLRERHPGQLSIIDKVLNSGRLAMELQFVMTRELFSDFMDWSFSLCREFERRWVWAGPKDGDQARAPAFLIERLFLVWLALHKHGRNIKVKEMQLIKLTARPWWYHLLKPLMVFFPERVNDRLYHKFK